MMQKKSDTQSVPGVWQTVAAGFDFTTRHLWLALLPVLLDAFFWLGPRLSARPIVEQLVAFMPNDPALADLSAQLLAAAPRTNLFTTLSVPLVGVPALMVGISPEKTPLPTTVLELSDLLLWLALFGLFLLIGLLLTAVYFTLIARAVHNEANPPTRPGLTAVVRRIVTVWGQLLLLGLFLVLLSFLIYLPLVPLSILLGLLSAILALFVLFLGPVILLWVVIYLFFAPHALALNGRDLRQAVMESFVIVRLNLFAVTGLLLVIFLIRNLLGTVLLLADDGSWLTLGSILGHAFITTSLVTATFIFYRDRYPTLIAE